MTLQELGIVVVAAMFGLAWVVSYMVVYYLGWYQGFDEMKRICDKYPNKPR